jgi:sugar/nucleoside kinase (ribokinase family)
MTALFDVAGIGNAIVDVLSFSDDAFLTRVGLNKNSMTLVDEIRAETLYRQMGQSTECSGGSVANSLAGIASLGGKTAFIGKVRDDQLGSIFIHDMHAVGVHFSSPAAQDGPATASCLVYVTPDAQRTMATFIGACSLVSESDIDEDIITNAKILYIEGYLWDTEQAKAAIRKAIAIAKKAGRKIAFTLSDTFCVDRHRAAFLKMIAEDIDILFANEAEIKSLYQVSDVELALEHLRLACDIASVTCGAAGSLVINREHAETVPTTALPKVVDTTGAGDLYAAGFLFGLTRDWPLRDCAALGNRCAGEIIMQIGARSMKPLHELVA